MDDKKRAMLKKAVRTASLAVSLAVLAVMGWLLIGSIASDGARPTDAPPQIEFTWTPLGPLTLQEFKGTLVLRDDFGLDFTTYRFRIVELDKTVDMPIEGLVGKEYETDIFLSWLAENPKILELDRLTIEISVADDRGQMTSISRVVRLKSAPFQAELKAF